MALDAWVNSSGVVAWDYNSSNVAEVYQGHLGELERIAVEKPTSSHAILHRFFSKCAYVLFYSTASRNSEDIPVCTPPELPPVHARKPE
jgi:hypothetical protein